MAVRRRTEPRVLIRRGQRDRVETVDFIAVADDLALGIAIPPAGARTLAADPGQAVIDMDKARGGHGGIAPRCAEWFRDQPELTTGCRAGTCAGRAASGRHPDSCSWRRT